MTTINEKRLKKSIENKIGSLDKLGDTAKRDLMIMMNDKDLEEVLDDMIEDKDMRTVANIMVNTYKGFKLISVTDRYIKQGTIEIVTIFNKSNQETEQQSL